VPALLCGNAVVWKPAEYAAALGDALQRLFVAGGLPDGVLNTVHADGPATFEGLDKALQAGLVNKIGFTGSSEVGVRIGELAGRHLQNACLELGGKNPLVVMPDADLDLAAEGALFSGFGTAGQRCTSLGVAIVHDDVYDAFLERFLARVESCRSSATRPTRRCCTARCWASASSTASRSGSARCSRTTRCTAPPAPAGSRRQPARGLRRRPGRRRVRPPAVVTGVRPDDALYLNETFGPLVPVMRFSTFDEAVELANGHGYGLSAAIYTRDAQAAFRFRERVSAGMLSVNNSTSGAEAHLPFGGNGKSGNGSRQSGVWVLDQFTRWQSMNWDYAGKLQKAQMDVEVSASDPDFRL
jgi:aldehyde dehydrogenase (NAD+)